MSETKHTPGPWKAELRNWMGEPSGHRVYISGDHRESFEDSDDGDEGDPDATYLAATGVAIVEGNATSRETTAANARLIAKAPALYAALVDLLERAESLNLETPELDVPPFGPGLILAARRAPAGDDAVDADINPEGLR